MIMMHQEHDDDIEHGSSSMIPQQQYYDQAHHELDHMNNFFYPPPPPNIPALPDPAPPQSLGDRPSNIINNYPYPPIPGPSLLELVPAQQQQQQQQHAYGGWVINNNNHNPDLNPPPLVLPGGLNSIYPPDIHQISWSTGLCDCCDDINSCLLSCFFPCYVFGKIAEIIDEGNTTCSSHCTIFSILSCVLYPSIYNAYLLGGQGCCGLEGEAFSVLAWYSAPFLYTCFFRQRMRRKYRLREAPLWDWLAHFLCMPCSLSQEYRELQARGFRVSQSWEQNVENQSRGLSIAQIAPPVMYPGMTR